MVAGCANVTPMHSESAEQHVIAALVTVGPALDPSRGARSRMRRRLLAGLRMNQERSGTSVQSRQRRTSITF